MEIRDILIKMLTLNPAFSFGSIMGSSANFRKMIEKATPAVSAMLTNNCF